MSLRMASPSALFTFLRAASLGLMFLKTCAQHIRRVPSSPNTSLPPLVISQAPSAILNLGTTPFVCWKMSLKLVAQAAVTSWVRKNLPEEVEVPEVKTKGSRIRILARISRQDYD